MELWVRSQDKEKLIKVDYLRIIENEEDKEFPFYINAGYDFMAAYKTKKRALEVLDEIQDILKPKIFAYIRPSEEMVELLGSRQAGMTKKMNTEAEIKELSTYVYEMPEE
jgi:hypothetical protein